MVKDKTPILLISLMLAYSESVFERGGRLVINKRQ